jgi:uncharacterized membrane protein
VTIPRPGVRNASFEGPFGRHSRFEMGEAMDERRLRQLFLISVILKGIDALIEVIGGLALAFVSLRQISTLAGWLTRGELVEDPHDVIANALLHFAKTFSISSKDFYAYYLASHGAIKLIMVAGLLANRKWAYPFGLVVMGLFIAYQLYEYAHTFSIGMLLLTLFDVVVVWLIWHEYGLVRARRATTAR